MKKANRGRPRERPTILRSFRIDEEYYKNAKEIHGTGLNKKVNEFIKRLSKPRKK